MHTVHVARTGNCDPGVRRRRYAEKGIAESRASAHMKREEASSCAMSWKSMSMTMRSKMTNASGRGKTSVSIWAGAP